jgi:hypothetical protein
MCSTTATSYTVEKTDRPDVVIRIQASRTTQGSHWGWSGISTFVCSKEGYRSGATRWTIVPYLLCDNVAMADIPGLLKDRPHDISVDFNARGRVVLISKTVA